MAGIAAARFCAPVTSALFVADATATARCGAIIMATCGGGVDVWEPAVTALLRGPEPIGAVDCGECCDCCDCRCCCRGGGAASARGAFFAAAAGAVGAFANANAVTAGVDVVGDPTGPSADATSTGTGPGSRTAAVAAAALAAWRLSWIREVCFAAFASFAFAALAALASTSALDFSCRSNRRACRARRRCSFLVAAGTGSDTGVGAGAGASTGISGGGSEDCAGVDAAGFALPIAGASPAESDDASAAAAFCVVSGVCFACSRSCPYVAGSLNVVAPVAGLIQKWLPSGVADAIHTAGVAALAGKPP